MPKLRREEEEETGALKSVVGEGPYEDLTQSSLDETGGQDEEPAHSQQNSPRPLSPFQRTGAPKGQGDPDAPPVASTSHSPQKSPRPLSPFKETEAQRVQDNPDSPHVAAYPLTSTPADTSLTEWAASVPGSVTEAD